MWTWKKEAKELYKTLERMLDYQLPDHLKDKKDINGSTMCYYYELCAIREILMADMLRSKHRTDGEISKHKIKKQKKVKKLQSDSGIDYKNK